MLQRIQQLWPPEEPALDLCAQRKGGGREREKEREAGEIDTFIKKSKWRNHILNVTL